MSSDHLTRLCFRCTECGDCCRRAGEVRFDDDRFAAMADHLNMELETFRRQFGLQHEPGKFEPWYFEVPKNGACPLLEDDLCSVHPQRPRQCRTYPFWPTATRTPDAWEREARHCPGIGLGEPWPIEEVARRISIEAAADAANAGEARDVESTGE